MKGFKRYEWYKDSGVEWIGKIPLHWEQVRMKFLCKVNPSKSDLKVPRNTKVTFLPMENIGEDGTLNLNEERELTDVWDGFTYFKDDDVIIAKITPCFENGKGALCRNLINGLGFGTTELHVLRAKNQVVPGFIWYVTKSHGFRVMGEAMMQGAAGQKRVPKDFIENFVVCVPTPVEQQAIVNFLDQKTAEIDTLIADKEKLIELLQEQRQAIITLAVTKGLDPNVPLKDSGIEWLGEIPEHWNCIRMKYICDINPSKSELKASSNTKITFLSMENISEEGILNLQEERELAEVYNGFTYFRENDVIVAKITPCFENGKVAICKGLTNGLGFGTTELHVLRAKNIVYAEYIYLVIQSHIFRNMGTALMKGAAGQKRVPTEFIQNFTIGIPPMNEQKDIINYVKQKSDYLFALINSTKIEIDKLKEYRQSLITAAVTGKIDVRNYNIESDQVEGEEQEEVS